MEIFALIGAPARIFGRLPLITRYLWNGFSLNWQNSEYARSRYGEYYRWRPWLLFDVEELRVAEELINNGTDDMVLSFRRSQLRMFQMVAIIVSFHHIAYASFLWGISMC